MKLPWSIRGVSEETRLRVREAAMRENVSVGHWLEVAVRDQLADGRSQDVVQALNERLARLNVAHRNGGRQRL